MIVVDANGLKVADCEADRLDGGLKFRRPLVEDTANAHLIAAAPELLDAARLAADAIGQTRDDFGLKIELEKAYLALRAALARAEGA